MLSHERWEQIGVSLHLSSRELAVVLCLLDELSNKRIASQLRIDEATVHSHLARIYQKLGVRGRVGAVGQLFCAHLRLPPEPPDGDKDRIAAPNG